MFLVSKQGYQLDAFKSRKNCFIEAAHYIFVIKNLKKKYQASM